MAINRIQIAKKDIVDYFDNFPSKVMNYSDIAKILSSERNFWRLALSTTTNDFINFMLKSTKLEKVKFDFPYRKEIRYLWGEVPLYEAVLALKPEGYLSHFTAMFLHNLTEQIPKTIYLNDEQSPPPGKIFSLEQRSIDMAFKRKARISKNIAPYGSYKICTLNSMGKGRLGILDRLGPEGETISVTGIERTLIDIAVRPVYSGGVAEVLNAFKLARGNELSLNKLAAMLIKMNYTYPYHQVIGFYLDKAGVYKKELIDRFLEIETKYDFYLTHNMKEMDYSSKWRLFFPKRF